MKLIHIIWYEFKKMIIFLSNRTNIMQKTIMRIFVVFFGMALLIPVSIDATTYENEQYGFTLEYPDGWHIDDTVEVFHPENDFGSEGAILVTFYDDLDYWSHFIEVTMIKNDTLAKNFEDQKYLDELINQVQEKCMIASFDFEGYLCSRHSILNEEVIEMGEHKAYKIYESWTETYPDNSQIYRTGNLKDIVIGNDVWSIATINTSTQDTEMFNIINEALDSFSVTGYSEEIEDKIEEETETKIPEWVRNIFIWYGEDKIPEDELIGALKFLIKEGIITLE